MLTVNNISCSSNCVSCTDLVKAANNGLNDYSLIQDPTSSHNSDINYNCAKHTWQKSFITSEIFNNVCSTLLITVLI